MARTRQGSERSPGRRVHADPGRALGQVAFVYLLLIAGDRQIMGSHRVDGALRAAGWGIAIGMTVLSIAYLPQQVLNG
jgi:hypothetical protein